MKTLRHSLSLYLLRSNGRLVIVSDNLDEVNDLALYRLSCSYFTALNSGRCATAVNDRKLLKIYEQDHLAGTEETILNVTKADSIKPIKYCNTK